MSISWNEEQSSVLQGKWFAFKCMGYSLLMIDATQEKEQVCLEYIFEKADRWECIQATVPCDSVVPSVTEVFPQGAQMQNEIAQGYPVTFQPKSTTQDLSNCSTMEWGPFHPLLPQPIKFQLEMKDELIENAKLVTGYNYRGLEELCKGGKPEDVLEVLERTSALNGFPLAFAFSRAIEQLHEVQVPERAQWLRMFLMEMTFLHAGLQSLNNVARSLGLMACSARIFRLSSLYQEAAALICTSPQFSGILEIGGLSRDIPRETLFTVNAILQEMEEELNNIQSQWENTTSIMKRLSGTGRIETEHAWMMTGRMRRAAGLTEDLRGLSVLPWSKLNHVIPRTDGSDCFARVMLMFKDTLLSLDLLDQMAADLPKGSIKTDFRINGSGEVLVCEPEAFGGMAVRVRQKRGRVQSIRIRNAAALNISFLPQCLKGMEINDLPMVVSTFELDLSAMEK